MVSNQNKSLCLLHGLRFFPVTHLLYGADCPLCSSSSLLRVSPLAQDYFIAKPIDVENLVTAIKTAYAAHHGAPKPLEPAPAADDKPTQA
jgi:hypothetical protein